MTSAPPPILTQHARAQLVRRGLDAKVALEVARVPEQIVPLSVDLEVRQSRVVLPPEQQLYLVRVIVATGPPARIVTAYRTSKLSKYWRTP